MSKPLDKRMTADLICKAIIKAVNLRQPPKGVAFHSDRDSQYTSKRFRNLLEDYGIRSSMGDVGACWDNAVFKRYFQISCSNTILIAILEKKIFR